MMNKHSKQSDKDCMGFADILAFSVEKLYKSPVKLILRIIVYALLIMAIIDFFYVFLNGRLSYSYTEHAFSDDIDNTGVLLCYEDQMTDEGEKKVNDFYDKVCEIDGLDSFGGGYGGATLTDFYDYEILDAQRAMKANDDDSSGLRCFLLNSSRAAGLYRLELKCGALPDEVEKKEGDELIYLGAAYSDEYVGRRCGRYLIAGILKSGVRIFGNELYGNSYINSNVYSFDTDHQAICVMDVYPIISTSYFNVLEGHDYKEVADSLEIVAKEMNVDVRVITVREMLNEMEEGNADIIMRMSMKLLLLLGLAVIPFVLFYIADIRSEKTWIFLSNGMPTKSFRKIQRYESEIVLLIASIPGFWKYITDRYKANNHKSFFGYMESMDFKIVMISFLLSIGVLFLVICLTELPVNVLMPDRNSADFVKKDTKEKNGSYSSIKMLILMLISFGFLVPLSGCGKVRPDDKKSITIAAIDSDDGLLSDIQCFRQSHPEYEIVLNNYDEYSNPEQALIIDITSGNRPDVLAVPRNLIYRFVKRGFLEDLYPYIDSDPEMKREDFIASILKAYEINNSLYQSISFVNLNSWVTGENEYTSKRPWDINAFKELIHAFPEKKVVISYSKKGVIKKMLRGSLPGFIDWQDMSCDFNNERFYDFLDTLSYVQENSVLMMDQDQDTVPNEIKNDNIIFSESVYTECLCAKDFMKFEELYGGKTAYLGPPVGNGSPTSFSSDISKQFSMVSVSDNKDTAWQFVRYFMTKDYQKLFPEMINSATDWRGFPVREDSFRDYIKRYTARKNYEYNGEIINVEEMSEITEGYTEEMGVKYRSIIDSTDRVEVFDETIMEIVSDELEAFFEGTRSREDTAEHVEKRVSRYLEE